ncbi:response regulator [Marinobacter sp. C2H3]|uniref:response regulator n=1 Tax=Marinobacter sp. C2H3 TaxID=3119003 RepID=UPI00300F519C
MRVLILEDDPLVGELLETVVCGLYPGTEVTLSETVEGAHSAWRGERFQLVIADWNLPDGSGLDLIRALRQAGDAVPVLMVSGRADRESVLQAAHYGIHGYITKPFSVERIHQRLVGLLPATTSADAGPGTPSDWLAEHRDRVIQLPGEVSVPDVLELMERQATLSPAQLSERWRDHTALMVRLLDVANGVSLRRSGKPVQALRDAIGLLGVPMTLNHVLALALDVSSALASPTLKARADGFREQTQAVARRAQALALRLGIPPFPVYKAALLSRVGELAVLRVLNDYVLRGGELRVEDIEAGLATWAVPFGNHLKIRWRLPLGLRELIGSVHQLPRDATRPEQMVMRSAALMAAGVEGSEECQRLLRRLGLDQDMTRERASDAPRER